MTEDQEQLFVETYPRAVRLACRILGDEAAAEDVAAEAIARAFADWERVGALRYRRAWVLRVATNLALDAVRRRPPSLPPARPVEFEDSLTTRLALQSALRALPARQREAVALRYLAGLPQAEVAAALGVSAGTAATHIHRGVIALRKSLGADEIGGRVMKIASIEEARRLMGTGKLVSAAVVGPAKGGMTVDIGIPALLRLGPQRMEALDADLEVTIVEIRPDENTVVVALAEDPSVVEQQTEAIRALRIGDQRAGRVLSVVPFGAFVEIGGGIYGLVHSSEMGHPVQVGDRVSVEVLDTAPERRRVSLRLVS
jgi:RNA polymerase sigma factor (sigma-70 family)